MNFKLLPKLNPSDTQIYARIDDDDVIRVTCTADYPPFQGWLAEGNTPLPADATEADE
jgi:hypothetical protein